MALIHKIYGTNIVPVRKAADFSSSVVPINGMNYYSVATDTKFVLLNSITLSLAAGTGNAIFIADGVTVEIIADNIISCPLIWDGVLDVNASLFRVGSGSRLILNDIVITNSEVGGAIQKLIGLAGGTSSERIIVNNCIAEKWGDGIDIVNAASISIKNSFFQAQGSTSMIQVNATPLCEITGNNFDYTGGTGHVISLGGASMNDVLVSNNRALNPTGDFIRIINNISSVSRVTLAVNRVENPARFFDTTGSNLNETDVRVDCFLNRAVKNSQALGHAFNNDNIYSLQIISAVNTPIIVSGEGAAPNSLDYTISGLTERFTIINTTPGQAGNQLSVTYDGDKRTFLVSTTATIDPASATPELGVGFFLNGSPLLDTFFTLTNADPHDITSTALIALTAGDILTIGVINKTNVGNIELKNPNFLISESA